MGLSDAIRQQIGDVTLIRGDCLQVMPTLAAGSVAMSFSDLPYGVTQNKWDTHLNMAALWPELCRVGRANSCYIFSATQPFASHVVGSNPSMFRYDLIWQKSNITGFFRAKLAPLRDHESLLVFYDKQPVYNPKKTAVTKKNRYCPNYVFKTLSRSTNYGGSGQQPHTIDDGTRYPRSVIFCPSEQRKNSMHPTQKPVALLEYLTRMYTNGGDTIFDCCAGSGTTAIAAMRVGNRKVVCIEKDKTYYDAMVARVTAEHAKMPVAQPPPACLV